MGKRKHKQVGNDLELYTGIVRMWTSPDDPNVEDMSVERFPATGMGNAHAFLVQCARAWLDDNGFAKGGLKIMYCAREGESLSTSKDLVVVNKPHKKDKSQYKGRVYKPYQCPIVALCTSRYKGIWGGDKHTIFLTEEGDTK